MRLKQSRGYGNRWIPVLLHSEVNEPRFLWEVEYGANLTNVGNKCFYAFIGGDQKTAFARMKGFRLVGSPLSDARWQKKNNNRKKTQ